MPKRCNKRKKGSAPRTGKQILFVITVKSGFLRERGLGEEPSFSRKKVPPPEKNGISLAYARDTIAAMTRLSTMNAVPQTLVARASLPS